LCFRGRSCIFFSLFPLRNFPLVCVIVAAPSLFPFYFLSPTPFFCPSVLFRIRPLSLFPTDPYLLFSRFLFQTNNSNPAHSSFKPFPFCPRDHFDVLPLPFFNSPPSRFFFFFFFPLFLGLDEVHRTTSIAMRFF